MITLEKLGIYEAFNGDMDGWARSSMGKTGVLMTDADWYLIDALLSGLSTVESGRASTSFVHEIESRVHESTAGDATRDALRALSRQRGGKTT